MYDDIPEARRQQESSPRKLNPDAGFPMVWMIGGLGVVILMVLGLVLARALSPNASSTTPGTVAPAAPTTANASDGGNLLGHFPYEEVSQDQLFPLADYPGILLQASAAESLERMIADARLDGVEIVPLSGFRSKEDQDYLFFEIKRERNQTAQERAKVSAPVGHSEHHTGYAIDLGDAIQPETHVEESFEETRAFQWLWNNAARYSFELSFPKNNAQGVNYEPWHWRFVGDQDSLETFFKGRDLKQETADQ